MNVEGMPFDDEFERCRLEHATGYVRTSMDDE